MISALLVALGAASIAAAVASLVLHVEPEAGARRF
jgi:hypothetical protein